MARGYQIKADVTSTLKGLEKLGTCARKEVKAAVAEAGELVLAKARELCPERTEQLKRSLQLYEGKPSKTAFIIQVGSPLPYTIYIELGVRPHTIDGPVFLEFAAKTKRVKIGTLGAGGRTLVSKGLPEPTFRYIGQHPGIKAHRFLGRALTQTKRRVNSVVKKAVKKAVKEAGK